MCGPFKHLASLDTVVYWECVVCVEFIPERQRCTAVADFTCQLIAQLYVSAWSMNAQC